jgi:IS30 family transposase
LVVEDAAVAVGVSRATGRNWFNHGGGMPPFSLQEPSGRYLSEDERDEIGLGLAAGHGIRQIARRLGRSPSTISREVHKNGQRQWPWKYLPRKAEARARSRAARPKPSKIASYPGLRDYVQDKLSCPAHYSPEQISERLLVDFPDDEQMRISHEAIYRSLFVQGRGELRRELTRHLRTGRQIRKPRRQTGERRGHLKDMVNISQRPAEAADRAVPGHWEGDLILGSNSSSAIGTLVERTTRFVLLLHIPGDRTAPTVRQALAAAIVTLPDMLRRSLTWDQGAEMAEHLQLKIDTHLDIYFCDPHSPWQRGTNENTNGLLRQYFPKGTDLSKHSPEELAAVAAGLNARPRKTLNWKTPAEALTELLLAAQADTGVATTT